jgi:hypothetical protein
MPMNRTDLKLLADDRVADARTLLAATRWSAAYYLLGYAVECALKACVASQFRQDEVPDKKIVLDFYTHDLEKLLSISGLKARDLLTAVTDPTSGVLPWLKTQW